MAGVKRRFRLILRLLLDALVDAMPMLICWRPGPLKTSGCCVKPILPIWSRKWTGLLGAVNYASLAQKVHDISIDLGLSYCYVFTFPDRSEMGTSQLLFGTNGDLLPLDQPFSEPFPTHQLLPKGLWDKHKRFDLLVEPLHFEAEIMGYMVVDACLSETWIYESFRTQISGVLKTLLLLENERQYASRLEAEVSHRTLNFKRFCMSAPNGSAFVAHELRSPLTGIQMTSELIDVKGREISEAELTKYLGRIKRSVDQMGSLIGRLLTLGRIETGNVALNLKEIEVSQLLKNLVSEQSLLPLIKGLNCAFMDRTIDSHLSMMSF